MDGSVVIGPLTRPHKTPAPRVAIKSINLALQGGGAHGAFARGVIDRLLEDERIAFDGISAASAGDQRNRVRLRSGRGWAPGSQTRARQKTQIWVRRENFHITS